MMKIFFFFLTLFLLPSKIYASSLNDMIVFEMENKNGYIVEQAYDTSFSFFISYNKLSQEDLDHILALPVKEDNHMLYIYDKLYIDVSSHYSLEEGKDYFLGVSTNWLSQKTISLPASDHIFLKEKDYIEVPIYQLKYRNTNQAEWTITDALEDEITLKEFLFQKLSITDFTDAYQRLYQLEEIPSSHIYNIRVDFYKALPTIEPILNEESFYKASSLQLLNTSYLSFHYQNVTSSSLQVDASFTPTKEDDSLISLLTLLTMLIGIIGLLTLKR